MKRRKNADDKLRSAYRVYAQDKSAENTIRYWREALRAGQLPEPSKIIKHAYGEDRWWFLDPETSSSLFPSIHREITGRVNRVSCIYDGRYQFEDAWVVRLRINSEMSQPDSLVSSNNTESAIKERLQKLIDYYETRRNPRKKRRNADDRLRRLQRQAESGDPKDTALYWRALLQAGITPEPTLVIPWGREETTRSQIWSLLGHPDGGYDIRDARIVLRSRFRFRNGKNVWEPDMLTKWSGKGFRGSWDKQLDFMEPAEAKQLLHQTLLEHIDENS